MREDFRFDNGKKTVLVTLVGGQLQPAYNMARFLKPEEVCFVFSDKSRNEGEKKLTKAFNEYLKGVSVFAPDNFATEDLCGIEMAADALAKHYRGWNVYLDISSGLKPWSYFIPKSFEKMGDNVKVCYVGQGRVFFDFASKRSYEMGSMDETDFNAYFALNGQDKVKLTPLSDYVQSDFDNIEKIERLHLFDKGAFKGLTNVSEVERKQALTTKSRSYTEKNSKAVASLKLDGFNHMTVEIRKGNGETMTEGLGSPHILDMIFNFRWFELKSAKMLRVWDKVKNVYVNAKFLYNSRNQSGKAEKFPKNETDILVDIGKKILFVECKTYISDSTDIDKFSSVVKNYGGLSAKKLFITETKPNDGIKEKLKESGCLLLVLDSRSKERDFIDEMIRYLENECFENNI